MDKTEKDSRDLKMKVLGEEAVKQMEKGVAYAVEHANDSRAVPEVSCAFIAYAANHGGC